MKPVLGIILTSYLMIVIDISIVIKGLPKIQSGLHFLPVDLSWVQNAYSLTFGGLLLLGARAGRILGHRRRAIAHLAAGCWLLAAPTAPPRGCAAARCAWRAG